MEDSRGKLRSERSENSRVDRKHARRARERVNDRSKKMLGGPPIVAFAFPRALFCDFLLLFLLLFVLFDLFGLNSGLLVLMGEDKG